MNDTILKKLQKLRSPKILIFVGLLGILLIFLSTLGGDSPESKKKGDDTSVFTVDEYRERLEEDISSVVGDITGSSKVSVVITLESGIKYSYADTREEISADKTSDQSLTTENEIKEGYITVKNSDGSEEALLITAEMPQVRGVAIVCEGGDNEVINEKIQNTVTAALNITSKRVYICGRKSE